MTSCEASVLDTLSFTSRARRVDPCPREEDDGDDVSHPGSLIRTTVRLIARDFGGGNRSGVAKRASPPPSPPPPLPQPPQPPRVRMAAGCCQGVHRVGVDGAQASQRQQCRGSNHQHPSKVCYRRAVT
ncbi:hypothetical protein PUN28_001651 [Cardiocondyla obscurior]|uniref:Uncharacterized protein n=1 Tax=Cardiocondyla obscurior TaxID=286306 RepID=A0AAW2GQL9_9HYME